MIAKLVDQSKVVDKIEHALNNTFNRSIRQLPSKMRFGVEQKGKIVDELKEKLEDINENTKLDSLAQIRKKAATHQKQVQDYNEKLYNKRRVKAKGYKKGDYVMVKNFDSTVGTARKLIPKHKGPYVIAKAMRNDRFLLKDVEGFQLARSPYLGVWSAQNLRHWIKNKNKIKKQK